MIKSEPILQVTNSWLTSCEINILFQERELSIVMWQVVSVFSVWGLCGLSLI